MKYNIRLIGLIILLVSVHAKVFAQDKVYLKNGTVIKGAYLHSDSIDLQFQVLNSSLTIKWIDISGIKLSGAQQKTLNSQLSNLIESREGWFHTFTYGHLLSIDEAVQASASVGYTLGYEWSDMLNIGIRTGLDWYGEYGASPVALRYAGVLGNRRLHPVLLGQMGYGFAWKNTGNDDGIHSKFRGGLYYQTGLGFMLEVPSGRVMLSFTGKAQTTRENYSSPVVPENGWYMISERKRVLQRFEIGLSYTVF